LLIALGAITFVLVAAKLSVRSVATGESVLPGVQGAPVLGPGPTPTATPGLPRARLRVLVLDVSGQPVPQAVVEIRDRFNAVASTQDTGPSGEVFLTLPATFGYMITVRKEGFSPGRTGPVTVDAPAPTPAAGPGGTALRGPAQSVQLRLEPLARQSAGAGARLFVGHTTSPRVSSLDPAANLLLKHSDTLGQGRLTLLAASLDATSIFASWSGNQEVLVIDGAELKVGRKLALEGGNVTTLAVHPKNGKLWVATTVSDSPDSSVLHEIDPATGQILRRINLGQPTAGLRFGADGSVLYARHRSTNALSMIDAASAALIRTARLPQWPADMAVSADGKHLYLVFLGSERLLELDAATGETRRTVEVGAGASAVAVHPDGRRVFVVNQILGSVQVVDLDAGQVADLIPVGRTPQAAAFSANSQLLFVANAGSGNISIIDPDRSSVKETIQVGGTPSALSLVDLGA
jgi:YVTN family beta-propeller protein